MFIPLTKVDAVQRLVYGSIDESVDRVGEVFDYATSKPRFQQWSKALSDASGGKNLGNIRAQHDPHKACGMLVQLDFDDNAKRMDVCGKVVDDNEWRKVEAGVYTGFSPGGRYVKRWQDGNHTRYTADPSELSIVDLPCIPSATFTMIKADGVTEEVAFKTVDAPIAAPIQGWQASDGSFHLTKAAAVAHNGTIAESVVSKVLATLDRLEDKLEKAEGKKEENKKDEKEAEKEDDKDDKKDDKDLDDDKDNGGDLDGDADDKNAEKAADGGDKEPYGDVSYADPGYQSDKKKRYPVDTAEHVRAAWNYINKSGNAGKYSSDEVSKIKARIVAAWKKKIDPNGPPSAEDKSEKSVMVESLDKAARLASLFGAVNEIVLEKAMDGDNSWDEMAALIRKAVDDAAAELLASEDADEALKAAGDLSADAASALIKALEASDAKLTKAAATRAAKLGVALADAVEKAARMSAANRGHVQGAHDHVVAMGADCDGHGAEKAAGSDELNKAGRKLTKAQKAHANKAHDHMVALGAEGGQADAEEDDDEDDAAEKAVNAEMTKVLERSHAALLTMEKSLEAKIEAVQVENEAKMEAMRKAHAAELLEVKNKVNPATDILLNKVTALESLVQQQASDLMKYAKTPLPPRAHLGVIAVNKEDDGKQQPGGKLFDGLDAIEPGQARANRLFEIASEMAARRR